MDGAVQHAAVGEDVKQRQHADDAITILAVRVYGRDLPRIGRQILMGKHRTLGRPVVPPVYWISATSCSGSTAAGAQSSSLASRSENWPRRASCGLGAMSRTEESREGKGVGRTC